MKNIPRLLPLVAVAIVGVLGINLLAGADSVPTLISAARAYAEGAPKTKAETKAPEAPTAHADSPLPPPQPGVAAPVTGSPSGATANVDAICMAREAGLSQHEMAMIQSLGGRREQLDARETDIDTQMRLLEAAERKLDAKIAAMNGLKADINGLLGQVDAKQAAETARLVKVFETMAPKDAAPRMATLNDEVLLPIAAGMKPQKLALIVAKMSPVQAKALTEKLAQRFAAGNTIADARAATAPQAPTAPVAAGPAPKAAPQAAAAAPKTAPAATPPNPAAARPKTG